MKMRKLRIERFWEIRGKKGLNYMKVIYWKVGFEMAIKEIIILYYMKGLNTQERTTLL
jgi:hypothetical protein